MQATPSTAAASSSTPTAAASVEAPAEPPRDGHDARRPGQDTPAWALLLALGISAVLLLMLRGLSTLDARGVITVLLLALAAIAVGALVGFLFGIPRALSDDGRGADGAAAARAGVAPAGG